MECVSTTPDLNGYAGRGSPCGPLRKRAEQTRPQPLLLAKVPHLQ
jgi:hypothetical protein